MPLGRSGIQVSRLALGSWRTYERISRDQGILVMQAAREADINFLDDARYNDETGNAPLPTGYSEVIFGELFRATGWRRDEVTVSNKLWWEFWPDETPAQELGGSLGRMGLDYVDLIYAEVPPSGVRLEDAVDMITGLIRAGGGPGPGNAELDPGTDGTGLADRRPRGRTRPEQVRANLGALAVADQLTPDERDRLFAIGLPC
jgi:aryl-alcohol dehydrogenase-like predicted oxidoreductase